MNTVEEVISESKVIAVVGLSPRENRASNEVSRYMQEQGYRIIPVNPDYEGELLGEKVYPDLQSIPEPVDVVDIFRRSHLMGPVVDDAVAIGAKAVWMQLGLVNEPAAVVAREAGLGVVMDKCILVEHKRMVREGTI
jgi:predicted CoA-binding protein